MLPVSPPGGSRADRSERRPVKEARSDWRAEQKTVGPANSEPAAKLCTGTSRKTAGTASKHAVVGLAKNSAVMYGPWGVRFRGWSV